MFARVAVLAALFQIAVVGGEPAPLQQRLQEALGAPSASATVWGAVVVRGDGSVVFSTNAHRAFIPASNTKLFIAAMALDRLGPEARWATPLRVHRAPDTQGTLHSDLWIVGQGDPTVGGTPRAADEGSRTGTGAPEMTTAWDEAFEPWVAAWQSRGLKRVEGDLVLCDAALRIPDYG
ncbi:MAG: D-alanyl-D-alanine carboxypeptidase, partial [Verrucomicrobiota bacterium]